MTQSIDLLSELAESNGYELTGGTGNLGYEYRRLGKGQSAGVDQVTLRCGAKKIEVLPTRGMGIWRAENAGIRFGWDSPIAGPVHPMWFPISEHSGLGWLDGFDEMMVRCGLESNGAPEFDDDGKLRFPLHGRIANLPASSVEVDIDDSAGRITLRGTVNENRFHFKRLQLQTEIALEMDSDEISITDRVTNLSDRPTSVQMLYHNNFGSPILEAGSQLFAPIKKLVPRNAHAAAGLDDWNQFGPPDPGYAEQVYFMELAADSNHDSIVLLANSDRSKGVSIRYDAINLPCFSVWKNTVGESDGYVCGLEPATNFPNPKSFEESHGRVIRLGPGEMRTMSLNIGILVSPDRVKQALNQVEALSQADPQVISHPSPDWCSP
jgi:galactose mutarotase-like enzyme